jgi:hypothetical protein
MSRKLEKVETGLMKKEGDEFRETERWRTLEDCNEKKEDNDKFRVNLYEVNRKLENVIVNIADYEKFKRTMSYRIENVETSLMKVKENEFKTTSEMEEGAAYSLRTGDVRAPATL